MGMIAAHLGLVAATEDCIEEASMTLDKLKSATCSQKPGLLTPGRISVICGALFDHTS